VDSSRDRIELDGRSLKPAQNVYFLFHKPRGIVCTLSDERGRPCLDEICARLPGKPRPVGRLDRASEGLLLLTNDGELANRLTHPRYGVVKEYQVTISPGIRDRDAKQMVAGVSVPALEGESAALAKFEGIELLEMQGPGPGSRDRSRLRVLVSEGRYRIIRRVCEALGYQVLRLKRVRLGPLRLGSVKLGESRPLSADEVFQLRLLTGLESKKAQTQPGPQRG
jgi:pseudouridine synthase